MDGRGSESRRNWTCLGGVVDLLLWSGGRRELEEARELEDEGSSMSAVYRYVCLRWEARKAAKSGRRSACRYGMVEVACRSDGGRRITGGR